MSSPPTPNNKVVLITGATSGIGKACAEHLARRGWLVYGTGRHPAAATTQDGLIRLIAMDVNDDESVRQGVETVLADAGRLDAVVNNAGIGLMGAVEDTTIEEAKIQLETNFFGVLRVCRAVLPTMRRQGHGHIVNISSLAGLVGLPFSGMYSASKFAVEGMTEALRLETLRLGIRVALIEPGDFRTEMVQRRLHAAASRANEAYAEICARFIERQDHDEANAPTPEPVAELVERILNNPNPKTRYMVGMFFQRFIVTLKHWLPQRAWERLVRRIVDL